MTPIPDAVRDVYLLLTTRTCLCCGTPVRAGQAFCGEECRWRFAVEFFGRMERRGTDRVTLMQAEGLHGCAESPSVRPEIRKANK
jgi:predicted nucleic acid-binding Zn ribbon protein